MEVLKNYYFLFIIYISKIATFAIKNIAKCDRVICLQDNKTILLKQHQDKRIKVQRMQTNT